MSQSQTQIVELIWGPLDGAKWQLLSPPQQSIVVATHHCAPQQPARTVRYVRFGDRRFEYDPNYVK